MPGARPLTLGKDERLAGRKLVDSLFGGGESRSMSAFPLRMVYRSVDRESDNAPQGRMMVSVPKRCFKRAVKRNRVKRQVREAYRHHKYELLDRMAEAQPGKTMLMAFICIDNNLHPSAVIDAKVRNLLCRLSERL